MKGSPLMTGSFTQQASLGEIKIVKTNLLMLSSGDKLNYFSLIVLTNAAR